MFLQTAVAQDYEFELRVGPYTHTLLMKFISWNVNGLRACAGKGFADAFNSLNADFFCLQETKMQAGQLDLNFDGYDSYWNYADKKGYSGTAVYTRLKPSGVTYGMGIDAHDHEGRVITLEYDVFFSSLSTHRIRRRSSAALTIA